ncbi:MAG TPA: hypothetical protein VJY15_23310 [Candidatus Acidoferrum sp.]|nr:hypothetical protein [Candidatus Acidoferrum sp.]
MAGNERTIAKPLSGGEVMEAIIFKIRDALKRDCYLAPHIAYDSYSFQAEIRVQFQKTNTSIKETTVHTRGKAGDVSDQPMESADVKTSDEPKPPNELREETGQGIPTIITKPQGGVEEKKVKYAIPEPGKTKVTTKKALTTK